MPPTKYIFAIEKHGAFFAVEEKKKFVLSTMEYL